MPRNPGHPSFQLHDMRKSFPAATFRQLLAGNAAVMIGTGRHAEFATRRGSLSRGVSRVIECKRLLTTVHELARCFGSAEESLESDLRTRAACLIDIRMPNTSASLWTSCPGKSGGLPFITRTLRGRWSSGDPASRPEKISNSKLASAGRMNIARCSSANVTPRQARNNFYVRNLVDKLRANDRTHAITSCEPARGSLNLTPLARSVETR